MSDGVFSQGQAKDGIMPQAAGEAGPIDLLVGSPFRIERKVFPELAVASGVPGSVRNRLAAVDGFWPAASVAMDTFPERTDNTPMPGGRTVGEFYHSQSVRRRAILARLGIAYLFRHAGDGPLTPEHVSAAYRFRDEHRDDPAPEPENPLTTTTYERSQTAGVVMDEAAGVGIRVRSDPFNTDEADEAARLERINAAPTHDAEGRPLKEM